MAGVASLEPAALDLTVGGLTLDSICFYSFRVRDVLEDGGCSHFMS